MKKILIILFSLLFLTNFANSESRFGELTEIRDEKMRGKDGQWVRPHPDHLFGIILKVKKEISFGKMLINMLFMHKSIIKQF